VERELGFGLEEQERGLPEPLPAVVPLASALLVEGFGGGPTFGLFAVGSTTSTAPLDWRSGLDSGKGGLSLPLPGEGVFASAAVVAPADVTGVVDNDDGADFLFFFFDGCGSGGTGSEGMPGRPFLRREADELPHPCDRRWFTFRVDTIVFSF